MSIIKRILIAWALTALMPFGLATCEKAHAQYSPPFNAYSVSTLGGNCTAQGSVMYQSANGQSVCLGAGSAGQVLESGGPGANVQWLTTSGSGTVTSVALSSPASFFAVSGSPVTGAGTLTQTLTAAGQNLIWGGPATGGAGTPSYRSLVVGDLPTGYPAANLAGTLNLTSQVTGTLPVANGGSGAATFTAHGVLIGELTSAFHVVTNASASQILIGQSAADPTWNTASGDVSAISATGAFTVASIGGHAPGVAASGLVQFNASTQYPAADGSLITKIPGTEVAVQVFSTAGTPTYTRSANATHGDIYVVGGGGAGGGAPATSSGQHSTGDGGGSGSLCVLYNATLPASATTLVGAGGVGASGAAGGNGGASNFNGTTCTATGGTGGQPNGPFSTASNSLGANTAGGTAGSGGTLNIQGEAGSPSMIVGTNLLAGNGGSSALTGGGAMGSSLGVGGAGALCGAGGGGSSNSVSSTAIAGGNGGAGCIIVIERQ